MKKGIKKTSCILDPESRYLLNLAKRNAPKDKSDSALINWAIHCTYGGMRGAVTKKIAHLQQKRDECDLRLRHWARILSELQEMGKE